MQITNSTGVDLYLAAVQLIVADGESIDVDEALAEQLVLQGWTLKAPKSTRKAAEAESEEN